MFPMTPAILRNFFSRRATRRYPLVTREPFVNVRGELKNEGGCTLCGICAAKCPSQCIVVDKKNATWQWDPFACVYCGVCVDSCKTGSLRQEPLYRKATTRREIVSVKIVLKKEIKEGAEKLMGGY